MAVEFKDRVSQHPNRRKLTTVTQDGGVMIVDVEREEGTVHEEGTQLNAINLNTLAPKDSPEFTGTPKKNGVEMASIDDTVAAAKKLVTSEPKLVSDVFTQRITATNDVEIIDSQPDVKTAEIKSIKGMTIKAIQKNGNFADSWVGWAGTSANTTSVSNKILTATLTELSSLAGITGMNTYGVVGHKYYISVWIKPKYSRNVGLGIGNTEVVISNTVANSWNLITGIVTAVGTGELNCFHDCSAQYVVGDTFEIQDFRCKDLTQSSQVLYNMTKEQLDVRLPNLPYFEGIRHTNIKKLTSIGDNFVFWTDLTPKTVNGVTMTPHSDGSITLNGTSTAETNIFLDNRLMTSPNIYQAQGMQMKIWGQYVSGTITGNVSFVANTNDIGITTHVAIAALLIAHSTPSTATVNNINAFTIYLPNGPV